MSDNDNTLTLPYAHLNLRYNPFGELTPQERAELAVVELDLEHVVNRLRVPGFAIQFLGKRGRGKSTHLFTLHHYFPTAPFIYVPRGAPIPNIAPVPVHFIDEMQRIPRAQRLEILRRSASFVIGSHINHRREFRKAGLAFEVIELRRLTVKQLRKIIEKRINWARRHDDKPVPNISEATSAKLIAKFGDDIRAIEYYLYEVFQSLTEVCDV